MFAKDREAMRLTPAEVRLILIESLQWCANNAVYFLGLIGAATYDLAGTAFLVAAITLVRNLMTSVGNMVSGSVIDRFGPRRTSFVTCVITAVLSLGVGLAPLSVPGLVFAACVLGLAGGFINTCTHAFPGYLESTTEGRTRVNGLMVFYSNIAYTAGPLLGGAIVSCFATQSVYLLMAGMMGVAAVLSLGCHECVAPAKGEKPKGGILGGMAEGARLTFRDHDLRLIFISGFLGFFAFGAFDSLESLFYRDVLNVDIVWLGWLSSVVGLTSSVGAFILTKLSARHVNLRLLLGALMAVGIGSMVYVGTDMLGVAIIGQAINGLAWGVPGAAADDLDSGACRHQIPGAHYRLCAFWPDERRRGAAAGGSVFGGGFGRPDGTVWSIDHYCAGRNAVLCHTRETPGALAIHQILI